MEKFSGCNTNGEPMELPPGFRFHPTDEELITHYLSHKVIDSSFTTKAIGDVDLNKVEPWDLPWRAKLGEKEWYFFCVRDRKYPTGLRTNRATEAGYWKATGKDREIFRGRLLVGMKKTLVFYRGRAPRGEKTNWVMHEFRLEGKHSMYNQPKNAKNEWVICRIFKKTSGGRKIHISGLVRSGDESQSSDFPPLVDLSSDERSQADLSHETLLSNPMENSREKLVDELSSSSSKKCIFSPFPFTLPHLSTPNSGSSSEIMPPTEHLTNCDSVMAQDQSILRLLLDDNGRGEASQGINYHGMEFKGYDDQEFPFISTAPIDLDCFWDY